MPIYQKILTNNTNQDLEIPGFGIELTPGESVVGTDQEWLELTANENIELITPLVENGSITVSDGTRTLSPKAAIRLIGKMDKIDVLNDEARLSVLNEMHVTGCNVRTTFDDTLGRTKLDFDDYRLVSVEYHPGTTVPKNICPLVSDNICYLEGRR